MIHEFSAVRTGKASPALVENVDVEAYGSTMKLKQLALITTPEPRLLVVQPFDAFDRARHREGAQRIEDRHHAAGGWKNYSAAHSRAFRGTAQRFGKSLKQMAEEARVRVRANRRSAMEDAKKMEKAGEATEDQLARSRSGHSEIDRPFREIDRRTSRAQRRRGDEGLAGADPGRSRVEGYRFPGSFDSLRSGMTMRSLPPLPYVHRFHAAKIERAFAQKTRAALHLMPNDAAFSP